MHLCFGVVTELGSGMLGGVANKSSSEIGMIKPPMNMLYLYSGRMMSEKLNLLSILGYGRGNLEYVDSSSRRFAGGASMTRVTFSDNYNLKTIEGADSTLKSKHEGRVRKSQPATREVLTTRLISVAWLLQVSRGAYLNARST